MGKYMNNSKMKTSVEDSTSVGVRTRAKTLASLNNNNSNTSDNSSSYLQLRSRNLQKPPPPRKQASDGTERESGGRKASSRLRRNDAWSFRCSDYDEIACRNLALLVVDDASVGQNFMDIEQRMRTTRESTPCNAVRDFNTIETHGSVTRSSKQSLAAPSPTYIPLQEINPTTQEIEDFFSSIELQEQQLFMEKYNFDVVNDIPLPGGFEWEQVRA